MDSDNILLKKYDKNGNEEGPVENLMTNSKEAISKDDFEYIKVIGRGAFAKVYLVIKKDT